MEKPKQKVICIGSMGKDVFLPVSSGSIVQSENKKITKKQLCFGYGSKVHIEDRFTAPGGCACNVSIGLARLGVEVGALGNVGKDFDRDWIVSVLAEEGINTMNIHTIDDAQTDLSIIIVDTHTGERTIFVNRDVGEELVVESGDLKGYDWCFVGSLYGNNISNNMSIIHNAITDKKIKLMYNPGGKNINDDENIVLDLIHHANIVITNKQEAQEIVSKFNLLYTEEEFQDEKFLMSVFKKHMIDNTGKVLLTDGLRGAWGYDGNKTYHTNTIDKPVHDTTGAGDAFSSGFLAAILHNLSMEKCMQWGSVNGDSVIDYYGAQEGLKKYDAIEKNTIKFTVENKK